MTMDVKQFRAFLDLMMCSDPWPVTSPVDGSEDDNCQETLLEFANKSSRFLGYANWIEAYHDLKVLGADS